MSKIKEPNFFNTDMTLQMYPPQRQEFIRKRLEVFKEQGYEHFAFVRDSELYHSLFDPEKRLWGEATPFYTFSRVAMRNIKFYNEKAKIIVVLRNPIYRAWSHYLMDYSLGWETIPFSEKINRDIKRLSVVGPDAPFKSYEDVNNIVSLGLYSYQLNRLYKDFPKEQVLVLTFEEILKSADELAKIEQFLGVSGLGRTIPAANTTKTPREKATLTIIKFLRNPQVAELRRKFLPKSIESKLKNLLYSSKKERIPEREEKLLMEFYREDIRKTSEILNKDLESLWLKSP